MNGKSFKRLKRIFFSTVVLVALITGCGQETVKTKTVTPEEVEETRVEEPVTEEQLDIILKKLQSDMRVFDVVDYHDDIFNQIKSEVSGGEDDDALNAIINPIVENYIQEVLADKIKVSLGENYAEADFDWLYTHVEIKSLQKLIVAYEREYIKHIKK
ncbi:hypothetical protein [Fusibacter sp. 3D3]|uniref:hypothetical protein n=1 Tax=Fusibacter sp. 3D3 TaxID=1048380 RepID=UPI0008539297|nr:hypothetical protein [Fusibacter sp. 3D3]GAU76359.1 hypothetical protein F3D3_0956 [Fusibacter sp. 3D3]